MRASVPAAGRVSGPGPSLSSRDMTKIGLYSLLLLLAMTVSTGRMSVVLAALALVLSLGKSARARMGERLCLPVLGFAAFALVTGLAALYGNFGRYAIGEYYKFLAAFGVAWVLLTQFEKKHVRGLLWGFGAVSGALALLSVDACGPGPLFQAFRALAGLLGVTFQDVTFFSGNRVNGLYNDANVTAAIFALGALVCLYLALSEQGRRGRASACLLLGLSAQGFFLSMSRGAIACFALTLAVWVAVAPRGSRLRLFLLMCAAALATVLLSFPAMAALGAGTPLLPALLRERGLEVTDVATYRVAEEEPGISTLPDLDYLTFESAGGVARFLARWGRIPPGCTCVCIGDVTAGALDGRTDRTPVVARHISGEGVAEAVLADWRKEQA